MGATFNPNNKNIEPLFSSVIHIQIVGIIHLVNQLPCYRLMIEGSFRPPDKMYTGNSLTCAERLSKISRVKFLETYHAVKQEKLFDGSKKEFREILNEYATFLKKCNGYQIS